IGQKSINNIVDATNFVMFDMGQPLHAFDAEKLVKSEKGTIEIAVRNAKAGERIATLDGKDIALDESMLVIVDAGNALAIAGVKGGKRAEVDASTTAIILEAANFHPTLIRKTSQKIGVRTDSSKRFENEIHPELAPAAIKEAARLIADMFKGQVKIGGIVDEYPAQDRFEVGKITVSAEEVNEHLGVNISPDGIESIMKKLGWMYKRVGTGEETQFHLTPQPERLDIAIKQDVIEEIGRMYGYENISPTLPDVKGFTAKVNKEFYYANKIRDILVGEGFSEIETSSFAPRGEIALENPIADGKEFLRESLFDGVARALDSNFKNAALLGLDIVKIFEIGTVFDKEDEHMELALGVLSLDKKNKEDLKKEVEKFFKEMGVKGEYKVSGDAVIINFTRLLESMPPPLPRGGARRAEGSAKQIKFQKISLYPFIVRDIALFVPENVGTEEISEILVKNSGELLARAPRLFDTFKPGNGKISYAFRLVFQSHEKTLTDEEVNAIIQKITAVLQENGWGVR
ncbi:phenylalanine--tRNA ligase subunit beta, partial [bacterium]|nr:phenylalanine--tRNA ligase subunit beta [bacterium]